jgi:hypothetical protein
VAADGDWLRGGTSSPRRAASLAEGGEGMRWHLRRRACLSSGQAYALCAGKQAGRRAKHCITAGGEKRKACGISACLLKKMTR